MAEVGTFQSNGWSLNMRIYMLGVDYKERIGVFLFLFLFVYPLFFVGMPCSTRIVFALLGIITFLIRRYFCLSLFVVFRGLIPMFVISIMTALINSTFDFNFAFYCISSILDFSRFDLTD